MKPSENGGLLGFTLVELVIVVAIIAVVAMIAVPKMAKMAISSKVVAAESDLRTIASAFTDPETGYMRDMRGIPGFSPAQMRLANLLVATNVYGVAPSAAGGLRLDAVLGARAAAGCAKGIEFTQWDDEAERGWRGPYVRHATGTFPSRGDVRFRGDADFAARGFFPETTGLRLAKDVLEGRDGCSVYGFPGEPSILDPWGNPYVLQIPPPQAFPNSGGGVTNVTDEVRFKYARVVSAGPDGRLDAPCFGSNATNTWATAWAPRTRRLVRQAGLIDGGDRSARGDDIVLFLVRNDVDEGEETD